MPAKRSGQSPDLIENLKVKNKCELKARSSKRETMICGVYLHKWEFMWPKDPEFFAKSREFSKLSDH